MIQENQARVDRGLGSVFHAGSICGMAVLPRLSHVAVPRSKHASRLIVIAGVVGATWSAGAGGWEPPVATTSAPPPVHAKDFASGVRIDWKRLTVEVEALVVLRRGSLELLACSPQTREHESILSTKARPLHIYQAMGLIGLEPGSPARYDATSSQWTPSRGEALELRVRYPDGKKSREVPVEQWLVDVKQRRPPDPLDLVFSGSRTLDDGRFAADLDGTVVCVVDFDTALIASGSLHSADNEVLWLAANTSAIPPTGTRCTLIIQRAGRDIHAELKTDGTLRRNGDVVTVRKLAEAARRGVSDHERTVIVLEVEAETPDAVVATVVDSLVRDGIDRARIKTRHADTS